MRLLLDTHIYLWWLQDSDRLSASARAHILNADAVFVSSASIWEAAIKANIGKLHADIEQLVDEIARSGFQEVPVTARHAARVVVLPGIHRDPFDRILIAQAICEPLHFLTADSRLAAYSSLVEVV